MIKRLIFLSCIFVLIVQHLGCRNDEAALTVVVKNELNTARSNETVTIASKEIKNKWPNVALASLVVHDAATDQHVVSQMVDHDLDSRYEELIFQADFAAGETKTFKLRSEPTYQTSESPSKVYAKFVPSRMDDFAWENDRIAYRMYGPALEASGEISSGVDVWVKSTKNLVLDKWYAPGNDYHTDHGEGLDYYKVGPSRGCGGVAMRDGKKLIPSNNFTNWKIIANGPVRTIFELTYAPWNFNGKKVSEVKRIMLDAGQNLNRFESTFTLDGDSGEIEYAIGIVKREGDGDFKSDVENGWLSYWEPANEQHGSTACGIVLDPTKIVQITETSDHHLVIAKADLGKPAVYYAGAGWSKSGDFPNAEAWHDYLADFAKRLQSPVSIDIQ